MQKLHMPIKLYETVVDECPYIDGQKSASILVDPDEEIKPGLFSTLSQSGFRRSGEMLYTPKCPSCSACISVRIPCDTFTPSRGQKRVWRKNTDLSVSIEEVDFNQEHFDLYMKYQRHRHPDSTMCDDDPKKYQSFIESEYSASKLVCLRLEGRLIGISVIDQFHGGLSAVYTFFDPQYSNRSIGTYAILYLIKLARSHYIPYVYLGYWVNNSPKMNYKRNFKPLEGYQNRVWSTLEA